SQKKAQELIENRYKGIVTDIKENGNQFVMNMVRSDVEYEVKVDTGSGEVLSIEKLKALAVKDEAVKDDGQTTENEQPKKPDQHEQPKKPEEHEQQNEQGKEQPPAKQRPDKQKKPVK